MSSTDEGPYSSGAFTDVEIVCSYALNCFGFVVVSLYGILQEAQTDDRIIGYPVDVPIKLALPHPWCALAFDKLYARGRQGRGRPLD